MKTNPRPKKHPVRFQLPIQRHSSAACRALAARPSETISPSTTWTARPAASQRPVSAVECITVLGVKKTCMLALFKFTEGVQRALFCQIKNQPTKSWSYTMCELACKPCLAVNTDTLCCSNMCMREVHKSGRVEARTRVLCSACSEV